MRIILASQSPARRRLLKRLGLDFRVRPAHVDEATVQRRIRNPRKLVQELAKLKARTVAAQMPGAVVIGSDQLLVSQGKVYGKPHTEEKACAQLKAFSGKTISLLTAVCVVGPEAEESFLQETKMKFRRLTPSEIRAYVRADRPLECAGSFKFESRGIGLFSGVTTDDPTAIEGLPLIRLGQVLSRFHSRSE